MKTDNELKLEVAIEKEAEKRYKFQRGFKYTLGQVQEFREVFIEGCQFILDNPKLIKLKSKNS